MGERIRLDKLLADCGKGSRSEVKNYIKKGIVEVNGKPVKSSDIKVDVEADIVSFDGQMVMFEKYVYYMLNKPAGVVSATTDNRDKTVIELITEDKPRDIFPVGRLDKDTEGLLIITNDGKLANSLLSPRKHVDKTYYAKVVRRECAIEDGKIKEQNTDKHEESNLISPMVIAHFMEGLDIGDDKLTKPAKLDVVSQTASMAEVRITITEGRYHQIKRMFEAVDMQVVYLKRLSMGKVRLDEKLRLGEFRRLTKEEISLLKEQDLPK